MNQSIQYQLINPSGNITAIVIGKYPPIQKQIINQTIFLDNNQIEQIGYIYQINSKKYFEMMGNEFSANGCRAAGYCFLKGKNGQVTFNATGINSTASVINQQNQSKLVINSKSIPQFIKMKPKIFKTKLFDTTFFLINSLPANTVINSLITKSNENAIGIIFYQKNNIYPYFYVKSITSAIPEQSCGSGSIVLSFLINQEKIIQPSGEILTISQNPLSLTGSIASLGNYNVKINYEQ